MIYYEKYGNDLNPVILCLHGSNFVHSFSKQYDALHIRYLRKLFAEIFSLCLNIVKKALRRDLSRNRKSSRAGKRVPPESRAVENGLLVLTAKDKLRLLPPLNITYDEIDTGIEILRSRQQSSCQED